ncbi:type I restriction endonuclease [Rapidithrix thailandica]|uniref:Type I restriction endonuclease n=1 Tax=Rapidithrix thailandica TaxID=413964 RepID=A0AAW9SDU1_9BACT
MDFIDRLEELKDRILKMKDQVQTEEATKNAFVMPFISTLGYDVFNPLEVVPEFTADLGIKKGEKIDYCILKDGEPIMIIECKHCDEVLDVHHTQLHRYFHVSSTRFGVLTNGITYRFFTDLDEKNKMDDRPFLEFSFENLNENIVNELKKFQKNQFDLEYIVNSASDLKYSKQIREILSKELKEPSEEFVRYFATKVYTGRVTQKIQEQFTELVQKAAKYLISDMISARLQNALDNEKDIVKVETETDDEGPILTNDKKGIITTDEETEGFRIIKAILRKVVSLDRIFSRDTKSYFGVLLDDNNRKPICRLHFNGGKKYIGLFDDHKKEERIYIEDLDNIYDHAERITNIISLYDTVDEKQD